MRVPGNTPDLRKGPPLLNPGFGLLVGSKRINGSRMDRVWICSGFALAREIPVSYNANLQGYGSADVRSYGMRGIDG